MTELQPLTDVQKEILHLIKNYVIEAQEPCPQIYIANIRSKATSSTFEIVNILEKKGYIKKTTRGGCIPTRKGKLRLVEGKVMPK